LHHRPAERACHGAPVPTAAGTPMRASDRLPANLHADRTAPGRDRAAATPARAMPHRVKSGSLSAQRRWMALIGNLLAGSHALAGDEIIKSGFADYAFEHYEIAAYKSLLVLAEQLGLAEAQHSLRQSLDEEEKMAAWLLDHLQDLTLEFLRREEMATAR